MHFTIDSDYGVCIYDSNMEYEHDLLPFVNFCFFFETRAKIIAYSYSFHSMKVKQEA